MLEVEYLRRGDRILGTQRMRNDQVRKQMAPEEDAVEKIVIRNLRWFG